MANASRHSAASCCLIAIGSLMAFAFFGLIGNSARAFASSAPVAAYSFDEGEGTSVEDLTGDGNTATIEGAEWTSHGKYGGAMKFNAAEEDRLSVPASEDLNLEEEFTLEAWVNQESEAEEYATILGKENSVSPHFAYILYAHSPYNRPEAFFAEGAKGHLGGAGGTPFPHTWTHIAVTDDGAHSRLYVNGQLVDTAEAVPIPSTDGDLVIGANKAFSAFFDGKIDEVHIYNRALDEAEIQADKAAPIQTPQQGPIAAYSFDEGEGTTVEDLSGDGNTATIEGAEWASRGKYGGAMKFNSSEGDVLTVPAAPDLDLTEEFTLEAWIHPESINEFENIFEKENSEEPFYSYLLTDHHDQLDAYLQEEPAYSSNSPGEEIEPHSWNHVALTYDGSRIHLYLNGEEVSAGPAPTFLATDGALKIGGGEKGYGGNDFDGKIDEVRVYNRALDEAEIQADKAAPIQTPQQGPIAAYSFDEGEGTSVEDLTGDGNTATIEGAEWVPGGKYGGAMKFNAAEEDRLSVPASEDLNLEEEFTLEAWVNQESEAEEYATILGKENSVSPHFAYILYAHSPYNRPEAFFAEGAKGHLGGAGGTPFPHTWTHIAVTDDGAHSRLYVNGQLVDTAEAVPIPSTDGDLVIGANKAFSAFFDGKIDEVHIYNRALDEAEIQADKAAPIQTPQQGPIAAYSFDEGEGTTVEDLTGDGNTATIEGAEWASRGKYGGALKFNSSEGDVLTVPAAPDLDLTEEFTLEAWIHPESINEFENIFEKENSEEPFYSYLLTDHHDQLDAYLQEEPAYSSNSPGEEIEPHSWNHVALTYDGSRIHLYLNGEEVSAGPAPSFISTDGALKIGGGEKGYGGNDFDGKIDEVRVYNRALDEGEIQADKAAPIQTPQQGPIAAYSFDEGEGTSVEDLSGDGNTATIEGTEWVPGGKYGGALEFDGEEDCVSIPESPELDFGEEFTLESWVRPEGSLDHDPVIFKEGEGFPSYALGVGIPHSGKAEGVIGQEGEGHQNVYSSEPLEANVWSHLALTYDGAKLRLFVDGELIASEAVENADSGSAGPLTIGCNALYGAHFQGKIDEVRIYNRALGAGELDFTPPSPPTEYEAMLEDDEGDADVYWTPSIDHPSPISGAATGVSYYRYRTNRTGSWGAWETTTMPFFEFEEAEEGDEFSVQAQAVDGAQNSSEITEGQVEVEPSSLTPENVGEEARPDEWKTLELAEEPAHPDIERAEAERLKEEEEESFAPRYTLGSNELCEGDSENPCGTYHPKKAAEYIYRWVREGNEEFWNHEFRFLGGQGGDCTNFTSQVLWAGGMNFARTHGYDEPDTEANGENHYGDYQWGGGSWWEGYFYFDGQLKEFKRPTESFINAEKLRDHLVEYGLVDYVPKGDPVQRGDIIFYNEHGTASNKLSHSQTVVAVTPGKIWVGQHSEAYIKTLRAVRHHVDETRGPQGNAWEYWIYRPVHTRANLNLP